MSANDRIAPDDLLNALAAADVLEHFRRLPETSRREFEEWIGKARDGEAYWRRIDTLVMAIRSAPRLAAEMTTGPATVSETRD